MKRTSFLPIIVLLPLMLSMACNLSSGPSDLDVTSTALVIIQTQTALAVPAATATPVPPTATIQPSETALPSASPTTTTTPTNSYTPTSSIPCNAAEFVQDLNYPDGSDMEPGQKFTKRWQLRNVGSCKWDSSYKVVYSAGPMSGPSSFALTANVIAPGGTVDISIELTAPSSGGTYTNYYMLQTPEGGLFGINSNDHDPFYVEIEVVAIDAPSEASLPELVIQNASLCQATVFLNSDCEVNVTVRNKGGSKSGNYKISFYPDTQSKTAGCSWTANTNATTTESFSCTYKYTKIGTFTYSVKVDVGDAVEEGNESNNSTTGSIKVMKFSGIIVLP